MVNNTYSISLGKENENYFGQFQLFIAFLMFATLITSQFDAQIFKLSTIALSLAEIFLIFLSMRISTKSRAMVMLWIIWALFLGFKLVLEFSTELLSIFVQQTVLLMCLFLNYRKTTPSSVTKWCGFCKIYLVILVIMDCITYYNNHYSSHQTEIFAISYFVVIQSKHKIRDVLVLSVFLFLIRGRGGALSMLAMLIVYFVFSRKAKRSSLVYSAIYCVLCGIVTFLPRLYILFYKSEYAAAANILVREYTGKNLFSGRERIWVKVFDAIDASPLFGIGGGIAELNEMLGMSTHNLFLFLQALGGYVLLLLFFAAFFYIWKSIYKFLDRELFALSAAYIVGLFLRTSFDLTFLANNFYQSVIMWLPIIFMLNKCQNNRLRNNDEYYLDREDKR